MVRHEDVRARPPLYLWGCLGRAGSGTTVQLARLAGAITLDGVVDDAWQRLDPLPLTRYLPVFRGASTQRTEIRVGYDDENLYIGGRFFDDEPNGVRMNSLYRDRWNGDDALVIYIDAVNDNTNRNGQASSLQTASRQEHLRDRWRKAGAFTPGGRASSMKLASTCIRWKSIIVAVTVTSLRKID